MGRSRFILISASIYALLARLSLIPQGSPYEVHQTIVFVGLILACIPCLATNAHWCVSPSPSKRKRYVRFPEYDSELPSYCTSMVPLAASSPTISRRPHPTLPTLRLRLMASMVLRWYMVLEGEAWRLESSTLHRRRVSSSVVSWTTLSRRSSTVRASSAKCRSSAVQAPSATRTSPAVCRQAQQDPPPGHEPRNLPNCKLPVLLGEVGGIEEYRVRHRSSQEGHHQEAHHRSGYRPTRTWKPRALPASLIKPAFEREHPHGLLTPGRSRAGASPHP